MSHILALLFLLLLGAHVATSAWRHGTGYFISTQICLWLTCVSGMAAWGRTLHGPALLVGFGILSLLVNIKFITRAPALDPGCLNLGAFRRHCRQTGAMAGLGGLTLFGIYALIASVWLAVIFSMVRDAL